MPKGSNKVRGRFLGGELEGLDQWIPKVGLRASWNQAEAFLRDERLMDAAIEVSWEAYESPDYEAVQTVFDLYREQASIHFAWKRSEHCTVYVRECPEVAAGLDLDIGQLLAEPYAFVNRFDEYIGAFLTALMLARQIAALHTDLILARLLDPTDVSDAEWHFVVSYLTLMRLDAPQRDHDLREVFNALRWLTRAGAGWRLLPHDLPPWHAVYEQTQRWIRAEVFDQIAHDLRVLLRLAAARAREPTAAIFDARTLQTVRYLHCPCRFVLPQPAHR